MLRRTISYSLITIALCMAIHGQNAAAGIITPQVQTDNVIFLLECRIQRYFLSNNKLPDKLSDLPAIPGKDNTLLDGWNNPVVYTTNADGSVTLKSNGGDRKGEHNTARSIQFSILGGDYNKHHDAESETFYTMASIERSIRDYASHHQKLPASLADLSSDLKESDGTIHDGWGHPIEYHLGDDGSVVLSSPGYSEGKLIFGVQFVVPVAGSRKKSLLIPQQ